MIILSVANYCHECLDFDADIERPNREVLHGCDGDIVIQTDTIVRCKYRNRCKAIKRYLEKEKQNAENSGNQSGVCGSGQTE